MNRNADYLLGGLLGVALILAAWMEWLPYNLTETLGFVTGAACVYLVVRRNVWNFPVGIANNLFFLVLFSQARLYGDAGLQLVYIALGVQGWIWWLRGGKNRAPLRVNHAPPRVLWILAGLVTLGAGGLMLALQLARGAAPLLDALTTALSLAAQYLLNRKSIENWYLWIATDILYIYLYIVRDLHLTALLYAVFLGFCLAGLWQWRRALRREAMDRDAALAPVREAAHG
ncbi:MAG: nicotinamide riboside transporter PnuC [Candidatus Contendobacter sp.]|nr:nicotinamide riboside transporter PnuC [Candidatus Contendobacter sp.]MDG4556218.1 nicotinamide riboside transporter PnuC [Candidatus Contendobacter sp.]